MENTNYPEIKFGTPVIDGHLDDIYLDSYCFSEEPMVHMGYSPLGREGAMKYMPNGGCGVVRFGVKGGRAAAEKFMKNLRLAAIETHVADARTCCLHPASATHRQMNNEELLAAGVSPDLVRYSTGIENSVDLIADIESALKEV